MIILGMIFFVSIGLIKTIGARAAETLCVLAVNRAEKEVSLALAGDGFSALSPVEHLVLQSDDLNAVNTADAPMRVRPEKLPVSEEIVLPIRSWNVLRFRCG